MRTFLAPALLALSALACTASTTDASTSEAVDPTLPELGTSTLAVGASPVEVTGFGSNPGALKLYKHVPPGLPAGAPLVLVLHGCTQSAPDAVRYGFDELADANGFLVGYPEQQTANNPLRCFNWAGEYGNPANVTRGQGENLSIKQMVDKLVADHKVDPKRVFIVGFSAGAAEAVLAAATWPDVFAGAASMAGIPYNCTTTYAEVSGCQKPGKDFTAQAWGDKVRAAHSSFAGPWPRISIWQGSADTVVGIANRTQMAKQWSNVHGLPEAPSASDTVDGQKHDVWKTSSGRVVVESYEIAGMDHGVPITGGCGTAGGYTYDKGICASRRIAQFFGVVSGGGSGPSVGPDAGGSEDGGGSSAKPGTSADAGPKGGTNGAQAEADDAYPTRTGSTCSMHVGDAQLDLVALLGAGLVCTALVSRRRARRQP